MVDFGKKLTLGIRSPLEQQFFMDVVNRTMLVFALVLAVGLISKATEKTLDNLMLPRYVFLDNAQAGRIEKIWKDLNEKDFGGY